MTNQRNPYIVGSRITDPQLFFGRESLFEFVEKQLKDQQFVILLHGQRRAGKSSVLFHIPNFVAPDEFTFIEFDLQNKAGWPSRKILYHLAKTIKEQLKLDLNLPITSEETINVDQFLEILSQLQSNFKNKKIAFLLDEFDILDDHANNSYYFFEDLKDILKENKNVFAILVIGRKLDDLPRLLTTFNHPPYHPIGLLDEESAKNLIIQPAKDCLEYTEDGIQAILDLSAGHPYYTQLICHTLFNQAREEKKTLIDQNDVRDEKTINQVLQGVEYGLKSIIEELSIEEKVMFSAIAETDESSIKSPLKLLESYGVIITDELKKALKTLETVNLVQKNPEESENYQIQVKLILIWLNRFHSLKLTVKDLDILNHSNHPQYQLLTNELNWVRHKSQTKRIQERISEAIEDYKKIIEKHRNCFTALSELAKLSLNNQRYELAYQCYYRLYLMNPVQYEEDFVNCSLAFIKYLSTQNDDNQIHKIYEQLFNKQLLGDYSSELLNYCRLLLKRIAAQESVTTRLLSKLTSKESEITSLKSTVTSQELEITSLKSTVTSQESEITSLKSTVTSQESEITRLVSKLTSQESEIISQRRLFSIMVIIGSPFIFFLGVLGGSQYPKQLDPTPQPPPSSPPFTEKK
jgi:uncharacterized coiled-coil protein SlyX